MISGSSFTGATAVIFGPNAAAFNVDSDTQITAQLPRPQPLDRSRCGPARRSPRSCTRESLSEFTDPNPERLC